MEIQRNLIVKSNRLIEAGYRLTLQEQRIMLLCIAKIKPKEQLDSKSFRITAEEYAAKYGVKLNNAYKELKQVINTLYNRNVKIYDKDANIEAEFRWIQKKSYFNNEGYAEIVVTDDLVPLLSELKSTFTSYYLDHVAGMKSVYAIRLYELFKQFGCMGKRRFDIDWLKERLQIEDLYPAFADLKRRVIDPALKEINNKSDILASYEIIKQRQKVIALAFNFLKRDNLELGFNNEYDGKSINVSLCKELQQFGVAEKQALELLEKYSEERIQQAIDLTKYNIETKQIKKSASGFLIRAIEEGFSSYELKKRQQDKLKAEKIKRIEVLNRIIEESYNQYNKFITDFISQRILELTSEKKEKYKKEFLSQLNAITLKMYEKHGLESKIVHSSYINFLKKYYESELPTESQFFQENGINIKSLRDELDYLQANKN